eukprot:7388878-Prymnesium_polylepis.2
MELEQWAVPSPCRRFTPFAAASDVDGASGRAGLPASSPAACETVNDVTHTADASVQPLPTAQAGTQPTSCKPSMMASESAAATASSRAFAAGHLTSSPAAGETIPVRGPDAFHTTDA